MNNLHKKQYSLPFPAVATGANCAARLLPDVTSLNPFGPGD